MISVPIIEDKTRTTEKRASVVVVVTDHAASPNISIIYQKTKNQKKNLINMGGHHTATYTTPSIIKY